MNEKKIAEIVKKRADEIRKSPNYDPRKEKELNDIYNQYVPPHSVKDISNLLDVAERDAYIDPFPPLGSEKKGGVAIKKGIRIAIGWYMQYIAQQVSTFGSGVAQALRAINNDLDEIKRSQSSEQVFALLNDLDLGIANEKVVDVALESLVEKNIKAVVSDTITSDLSSKFKDIDHLLLVGPNVSMQEDLDPAIDLRISDINSYLLKTEASMFGLILLHGSVEFLPSATKISLIENSQKALGEQGVLVIAIRAEGADSDLNETIASELLGQPRWSPQTWTHALSTKFSNVETKVIDGIVILISRNEL